MYDLPLEKKLELNSLVQINPHSPTPSTDRFRRVSPLICGLIKHISNLKQNKVPQNTDLSNSRQNNTHILVYEDGFQHVCPSLLKLQKNMLQNEIQISCCTEDPVQLLFLKEFAKPSECDTKR